MTPVQRPIGLLYSSLAGKTERVAKAIAQQLTLDPTRVLHLRDATPAQLTEAPSWIICVPTYGMGDLDHHTRRFFSRCTAESFSNTCVWPIVLGDQRYHGKTFAGALAKIVAAITQHGGQVKGMWPNTDYSFEASPSLSADNNFPGLVLDEVNQPELTAARITRWLQQEALL